MESRTKMYLAVAVIAVIVIAAVAGYYVFLLPPEKEIPIGTLAPMTGGYAFVGENMQAAIRLAAEEINEAGGPLGRKIKLYHEDGADADSAVLATQKLIEVNDVSAILGTFASGVTLSVVPVCIENEVVEISTSATPTLTTLEDNDYIYRTQPSAELDSVGVALAALKTGAQTAGLMAINYPGMTDAIYVFKSIFEEKGGEIVADVIYSPDEVTYRAEIEEVWSENPDIVFLSSYTTDASIIVKEWYELGFGGQLIGWDWAMNPDFIEVVGEAAEGIITTAGFGSGVYYEVFEQSFMDFSGKEPEYYACQAYDQMNLVALAIEAAGDASGPGIKSKLREVSSPPGKIVYTFEEGAKELREGNDINYEGVSGPCDFDEYGDVLGPLGIFEISEGQKVQIDTISVDEMLGEQ